MRSLRARAAVARSIPALLVAVALGVGTPPLRAGAASSSAASTLAVALRNAKAAHWVHETVRVVRGGVVVETSHNDIGTSEGLQVVTSPGGGSSRLVAFDRSKTLYVRANASALTFIYLMTSTNAATYAGQWLELTPSDSIYGSTSFATTLASDFSQVRFTGQVTLGGPTTFEGRRVRTLKGVVPAMNGAPRFQGTLYVTAQGPLRPVGFREVSSKATIVVAWSGWGHAVRLSVPAGAVAYPTT